MIKHQSASYNFKMLLKDGAKTIFSSSGPHYWVQFCWYCWWYHCITGSWSCMWQSLWRRNWIQNHLSGLAPGLFWDWSTRLMVGTAHSSALSASQAHYLVMGIFNTWNIQDCMNYYKIVFLQSSLDKYSD